MDTTVVEWAPFRLLDGKTEDELLEASSALQVAFVAQQPGFIKRELVKHADGSYVDLIHWRSQADAEAAMKRAESEPACAAFFQLMGADHDDPSAGVSHYRSIATY